MSHKDASNLANHIINMYPRTPFLTFDVRSSMCRTLGFCVSLSDLGAVFFNEYIEHCQKTQYKTSLNTIFFIMHLLYLTVYYTVLTNIVYTNVYFI